MNHLQSLSLIQSRAARLALARQRFFEEGQAPTGVVGSEVFESWSRCLRLHGSPHRQVVFQPVTASRTQLALMKNRSLHQAWMSEVPGLEALLSSTSCSAMLTDASGVLIGSCCSGRPHESLLKVAHRIGVNLSEDAVGTNAPGVTARTGKPVCVLGGEHFFDSVQDMHCAAAPVRDIHGRVAGVLDISSECIPFSFDAAVVVSLFASALESRLLVSQSSEHLVIRFQVTPDLLDSAMAALVGLDGLGRVAWMNLHARRLLQAPGARLSEGASTEEAGLGQSWAQLAALPTHGARLLTLPGGLTVWARADMRAPDGRRGLAALASPSSAPPCVRAVQTGAVARVINSDGASTPAAAAPAAAEARPPATAHANASAADVIAQSAACAAAASSSAAATSCAATARKLRESDLDLIQQTLQACHGNVSAAAKRLGVSRGLIYRRLRPGAGVSAALDA
jgi:transcriptional regulator of acetoin/glycerol metabolism